jgi:outer membrane receptor for ferrienterochelin and colicins
MINAFTSVLTRVRRSLMKRYFGGGILLLACLTNFSPACAAKSSDNPTKNVALIELGLQELMEIEVVTVYGASKFEQKLTEAPAAVSIVTSSDIKRYGYRTLADIMRSVRGFYATYDRNYHYLGIRGFSRPGDYNTRFLLLVDGHRVNENIYQQAPIGTDFPVDVDLIDRVEVIRGPSSSIYGTNAFMGVINVITKKGNDLMGMEVSGEAARYDTYKGRLSYGKKYASGLDVLVSGSTYDSKGQRELYYPEFDTPADNNGIARNADGDRYHSLFSTLLLKGFRLQGAYISRDKNIPTAPWGVEFNNTGTWTGDERGYVDLKYEHSFDDRTNITSTLYYDYYQYRGNYRYPEVINPDSNVITPAVANKDDTVGQWWGGDVKLTTRLMKRHTIIIGGEFVDNFRQDQINYDEQPYKLILDDRRSSRSWALYVQDEFTILENLILNIGLRHDYYDTFGRTTNPRVALIYRPLDLTTIKFLFGTAFRAPSPYELYDSPDLQPERIETYELVLEQSLGGGFRLATSLFVNNIKDIISMETDIALDKEMYRNVGKLETKGAELELEKRWVNGLRGLISYTYQETESKQVGEAVTNSPTHLMKANLMVPLLKDKIFAGLEEQYMSKRSLIKGSDTGSFLITNFTLSAQNFIKGMDASMSVYNLFNETYADPASHQHTQSAIEQDGLSFRLKMTYRF